MQEYLPAAQSVQVAPEERAHVRVKSARLLHGLVVEAAVLLLDLVQRLELLRQLLAKAFHATVLAHERDDVLGLVLELGLIHDSIGSNFEDLCLVTLDGMLSSVASAP